MWRSWLDKFKQDDCGKTKDLLSAYIDDILNLKERQQVERHLEVCPKCRAEPGYV